MEPIGAAPPPTRLAFELELAPVSQQASASQKAIFKAALRSITETADFLFCGDIQLSVEWHIHERARYETDRTPDVDNILKPLIDALCGPSGLIIDDNQIQHVQCSWIDWNRESEQIRIELKYSDNQFVPKAGLQFVQLDNGLCFPIPGILRREDQLSFVRAYAEAVQRRSEAMQEGMAYPWANVLMPMQRVFHRTRLGEFPVTKLSEFETKQGAL